jgi:hypothetical protein
MLDNRKRATSPDASAESRLAVNGAFRDGMYLGKLAADNGEPQRPAVAAGPQNRIVPHSRPAISGDTSNLSLALFHRNLPATNSSIATLSVICGVQE